MSKEVDKKGNNELKRSLSMRHLLVFGLVMMSPLAPFQVYGMVAGESFGMVSLVYLIGAFLMLFTALSYAQMSKEFPFAGSLYSYVQRGINSHVGFVAGWTLLSDYILAPALVSVFAGMWMNSIVPAIPALGWAAIFIVGTSIINICGVEINAKFNTILFWLQMVTIVVFAGFAIKFVFVNGLGVGGFSLDPIFQGEHVNLKFVATSVSIIVLGFIGFDGISTLSEEVKDPKKSVGRATVMSLVTIGFTFLVLTYLAGLVHPNYSDLDPDMALFDIAKEMGGMPLYVAMIIVNVLAVGIAVTLNVQSAVSRILFSMSRDELLPGSKWLKKLHPKFATPVNAIILAGVIAFVVAAFVGLGNIISLINFGAITSFAVLNLTVIYFFFIKKKKRDLKGFFNYLLFPLIGFVVAAFVWTGFDKVTYIFGFSWLAVGVIIGFIKSKGYKESGPVIKDM